MAHGWHTVGRPDDAIRTLDDLACRGRMPLASTCRRASAIPPTVGGTGTPVRSGKSSPLAHSTSRTLDPANVNAACPDRQVVTIADDKAAAPTATYGLTDQIRAPVDADRPVPPL